MVLPPRCLSCGDLVPDPGRLCAPCWSELRFITAPACSHCGEPFELPVAGLRRCGACIARPPVYDQARAALVYDDFARRLIVGFKHRDRTEHVPLLARWLATASHDMLADADVIVPVPLHRWRLWQRRFNQSALLAQSLGGIAGRPVALDLLSRVRPTPSQARLNARQRRRNVRAAFKVPLAATDRLANQRVLLIDDVMTTGATVDACSRALRRAGASWIGVATVARVVRPLDVTI